MSSHLGSPMNMPQHISVLHNRYSTEPCGGSIKTRWLTSDGRSNLYKKRLTLFQLSRLQEATFDERFHNHQILSCIVRLSCCISVVYALQDVLISWTHSTGQHLLVHPLTRSDQFTLLCTILYTLHLVSKQRYVLHSKGVDLITYLLYDHSFDENKPLAPHFFSTHQTCLISVIAC